MWVENEALRSEDRNDNEISRELNTKRIKVIFFSEPLRISYSEDLDTPNRNNFVLSPEKKRHLILKNHIANAKQRVNTISISTLQSSGPRHFGSTISQFLGKHS